MKTQTRQAAEAYEASLRDAIGDGGESALALDDALANEPDRALAQALAETLDPDLEPAEAADMVRALLG